MWIVFIFQVNAQESKEQGYGQSNKNTNLSNSFILDTVNFNSKGSDIFPRIIGNKVVFSANINSNGELKSFFDLYKVNREIGKIASKPERMGNKLTSRYNDLSPAFSKDNRTVYFTRNNSKNNFFKRDWDGYSRFMIFKAVKKGKSRVIVTELPFNRSEFSIAHPCLNEEEDKLYFVSDMPGSIGKTDIYLVKINEDGTYGVPINLGNKINTDGNETAPFISKDNILYFASDGHYGLGGLDVFSIDLNVENAVPINLGVPINSSADDFGFVLSSSQDFGYISSNRNGGMGQQDIYAIRPLKPVQGLIRPIKNELIIEEVDVLTEINIEKTKRLQNKNIQAGLGTEISSYLFLDTVLFYYNQNQILEESHNSLYEIAQYLERFPELAIEVVGHTDKLGANQYNIILSEKRALMAKSLLVNLGVAASRVSVKGAGSSEPCIFCDENISWRQLEQNRRVDFIVIDN